MATAGQEGQAEMGEPGAMEELVATGEPGATGELGVTEDLAGMGEPGVTEAMEELAAMGDLVVKVISAPARAVMHR